MITSLYIDGFKTLSEFSLTLEPGLNVLVGPNGSGKTNIISFFEFLSLAVERDPSAATSNLGGAGAIFRRVRDTYQPKIQATVIGCFSMKENLNRLPFRLGGDPDAEFASYQYDFSVLFSPELETVVFSYQRLRFRYTPKFKAPARDEDRNWDIDIESAIENDLRVSLKVRSVSSSALDFLPFTKKGSKAHKETEDFFARVISPTTSLPSLLTRFTPMMLTLLDDLCAGKTYNIVPSRVKVLEDSAKPPGISSDGSGLSSTLYSLRKRNVKPESQFWSVLSPQLRSALKTPPLETLVQYFKLANSSIKDVDVVNDSFTNQLRVTFAIQSGDYTARVPLSLMSDGTLKWLTLLTAALTSTSVLSIEEPENYLHPTMQGQFVKIMREILFNERNNACTLMTTHSETLLNHCTPSELIVVALRDGRTVATRFDNEADISDEIARTGFGLGYYYIAGAIGNE